MKEKNIQELAIRMGLITVEDMCQYTIAQLVVKIANKVNELVTEVWRFETDVQEILKTQNENIQYLLGEGLHLEVENIFDGWVKDGTFDTLINQTALKKVNDLIDETNAQLSAKANKTTTSSLQSQINNLVIESGGDSNFEVVQSRVDSQGNVFPTLKDNFDNLSKLILNGEFNISFGDWVQGAVQSDGSENNDSKFIRTSDFHFFSERVELIPSENTTYRIAKYNVNGSKVSVGDFITTPTVLTNDGFKYKISIGKVDGSAVTPNESGLLQMVVDRNIHYTEYGASFIKPSKNLVDNKNIKMNTLINATTGLEESNSNYACTDFIPYKLGQELYVSGYRNYVMYNANKEKILVNTATTTDKSLIKITSSSMVNVAYVRFSVYKEYANTTMVSYTDYSHQDEYGLFIEDLRVNRKNLSYDLESYINEKIQTISESVGNTLNGKSLLIFGDSIGAGDGNNGIGVAELIATRNEMVVYDYAKGGATITEQSTGGNNIITKINEAIASGISCDYIIFNGLTNDINGGALQPLGEITSDYSSTLDKSTFCGGFEYICKTLKTQWLGTKILYFRPHCMSSRNLENQKLYGSKAIEICKKWNIPVVDLFEEGGLNTFITSMKTKYTNNSDGTHPNELGYLTYYVPQIESKIKMM